jgi:hypothetical protein
MGSTGHCTRGVSLPQLLERSIRLGQRRVALQRMLMMEAAGIEVSEAWRAFCQPARNTVPLRELDRMYQAARAWAGMVGGRGALGWFEDCDFSATAVTDDGDAHAPTPATEPATLPAAGVRRVTARGTTVMPLATPPLERRAGAQRPSSSTTTSIRR